jgi:hypothetical protein
MKRLLPSPTPLRRRSQKHRSASSLARSKRSVASDDSRRRSSAQCGAPREARSAVACHDDCGTSSLA